MTVIVGILCSDGVVIGADGSATFAHGSTLTISQPVHKLRVIANSVIVAGTGAVGLGQRFAHVVEKSWDERVFTKQPAVEIGCDLSRRAMADFGATNAPRGAYGALVAFPYGNRPYLCEFDIQTLQPELKDANMWYVSMGSGQPIADPFLGFIREALWRDGLPSLNEGVFAAVWTLRQTIDLSPGGVKDPISISVLEGKGNGKFGVRLLDDDELQQHLEHVAGIKDHILTYRTQQGPAGSAGVNIPNP